MPDRPAPRRFDVFLSYSTHDKDVAERVLEALEAAQMAVWIAPRDIKPGDNWGSTIVRAIGASGVMVVIYSANSNESDHVLREVERAVDKKVRIVPVRVDDTPLSEDMEYFLSTTHWLNAHEGPIDLHLDALVQLIREMIGRSSEPDPATGGFDTAAGMPVHDLLASEADAEAARAINAAHEAGSIDMPAPPPAPTRHASAPATSRRNPTLIVVAAVLLLALVAVGMLLTGPSGGTPSDSPDPNAPAPGVTDTPTDTADGWINLIPRIDPQQHAVSADWSVTADGLVADSTQQGPGILALPFDADGDYEARMTFTRRAGRDSIAMIFSLGHGRANFEMDCWGEQLGGIQLINNQDVRVNETRRPDIDLRTGQTYTMTLRVVDNRFTGSFTGPDVNQTWQYTSPDNGRELSVHGIWNLTRDFTLGIGLYDSTFVIHQLQARRIAGQ